MVLGLVSAGEQCEIVKISHCGACSGKCGDHGPARHDSDSTATRAEEIGLRVGKRIDILRNEDNELLVQVDDSRITLDRRMAMKIVVRCNG